MRLDSLVAEAVARMALLIEFGGGLVAVFGCARGLLLLVAARGKTTGLVRARLAVADGIIAALGFKTAATLLKTLELRSWDAILAFAAILTLRTVVKRVLAWEGERLRRAAGRREPAS